MIGGMFKKHHGHVGSSARNMNNIRGTLHHPTLPAAENDPTLFDTSSIANVDAAGKLKGAANAAANFGKVASDARETRAIMQGANDEEGVALHSTDNDEEIEHRLRLQTPRGFVHPHARSKQFWDVYVAALILYSVIEVPYRVGFNVPARDGWLAFGLFIDFCFFIDIILNFRQGYVEENGTISWNPARIRVQYHKAVPRRLLLHRAL